MLNGQYKLYKLKSYVVTIIQKYGTNLEIFKIYNLVVKLVVIFNQLKMIRKI